MKKAISPAAGILLVIVALGIVFAAMWLQSEAPVWNKLPKGSSLSMPAMKPGAKPPVQSAIDAKKTDTPKPSGPAGSTEKGSPK